MSLSKQFHTNPEAEQEGAWVDYGPNADKTVPGFKLSRMAKSNKRYTKTLDRVTKPHRRSIELETMDNDQAEEMFAEVFVETILLDWRNIPLSDVTGNADDKGFADFTKANALALFKRLPELYEDLQDKAKKASLFRDEALEREAKN